MLVFGRSGRRVLLMGRAPLWAELPLKASEMWFFQASALGNTDDILPAGVPVWQGAGAIETPIYRVQNVRFCRCNVCLWRAFHPNPNLNLNPNSCAAFAHVARTSPHSPPTPAPAPANHPATNAVCDRGLASLWWRVRSVPTATKRAQSPDQRWWHPRQSRSPASRAWDRGAATAPSAATDRGGKGGPVCRHPPRGDAASGALPACEDEPPSAEESTRRLRLQTRLNEVPSEARTHSRSGAETQTATSSRLGLTATKLPCRLTIIYGETECENFLNRLALAPIFLCLRAT